MLSSYEKFVEGTFSMKIRKGAVILTRTMGVVKLHFENKYLILNNIYFILNFIRNLIYVSK